MTFCCGMWFLRVCSRTCSSPKAHVLISHHPYHRICPVSLSLHVAILNLAVWCMPATSDLCAATARHDTHQQLELEWVGGPGSAPLPRHKVKWRSPVDQVLTCQLAHSHFTSLKPCLFFSPPCFHPSWPGTVSTTAEFGKAVLVVVTSVCKGVESMSMKKNTKGWKRWRRRGGTDQTRGGDAEGTAGGYRGRNSSEIKGKNAPKSQRVKDSQGNKKDGDKKRKTTVTYGEDKADGHASHQYGSNQQVCSQTLALPLSLWSGKMYFSAFYTHVFMKWWEI